MRILHICNDYCGSKVHANLYQRLDKLGVEQLIYTYYRGGDMEGKNRYESELARFFYRPILKKRHRVLFHEKVQTMYDDLAHSVENFHFDLAHATTLFCDGQNGVVYDVKGFLPRETVDARL